VTLQPDSSEYESATPFVTAEASGAGVLPQRLCADSRTRSNVADRPAARADAAGPAFGPSAQLSVRAGCRGTNSLQLDEPLITPRTSRHPPTASGGNMYLHLSQRTSGVGAGPYSAARLERPQTFVI
jgi:hypothetical protein